MDLFLCLVALLPPFAQSQREIEALVSSPQLGERLGSGSRIESIVRTDSGYVVATADLWLRVEVVYRPSKRIGPAEFDLVFQEPIRVKKERP
jgi:hypothetical protein